MLKNQFICGYKDIENKHYAGASHKHEPDGEAVDTTNGAGPHNIQIFVLAPDGTVMTCLPGYWNADDLASELQLSQRLYKVWQNSGLNLDQKDQLFRRLQLAHIYEHSQAEHDRSHMQDFDISFEKNRMKEPDLFDGTRIDPSTGRVDSRFIKTTDVIMHQRMAAHPFEQYKKFDVAAFSDYGQSMYDKGENRLTADGSQSKWSDDQIIGNDSRAHPVRNEIIRQTAGAIPYGGMVTSLSHVWGLVRK